MILTALTLVTLLAFDEPRFEMTNAPGDKVGAAIYFDLGGDRGQQARTLLNSTQVTFGDLPVRKQTVAFAVAASAPPNAMVLFSASPDTIDRACLLTPTGTDETDNLARALDWCLSFLGTPATVDLPAVAAPEASAPQN